MAALLSRENPMRAPLVFRRSVPAVTRMMQNRAECVPLCEQIFFDRVLISDWRHPMAKRKKRAAASRSSRKKRIPPKRRTAAKRRTTAKQRTATKRRISAKRQSAAKRRAAPRRSNASKRSQSDPRIRGDIMLVGSLPFETVEEGLRAVGSKLGDDVIAIPDGEIGPRKMWCMFLATDTYSKHHDLVESRRPSPGRDQQRRKASRR
jgi:hypothetical protein